ncbi:hypothetical protein SAMN05519103_09184 [Rhizobiales bacterium GAS113]|nr:hypothetical protein SAMN05519103_09184 [Rhizobiales bacterium GAS113]SEF07610.1 hypothetical protein SAMN05519104_8387 [Rhizobiales bacterium GAS188]
MTRQIDPPPSSPVPLILILSDVECASPLRHALAWRSPAPSKRDRYHPLIDRDNGDSLANRRIVSITRLIAEALVRKK